MRRRFYRTLVRRLSTFPMKTTPAVIPVLAFAISMITRFSLNAEDKDSAEARNARYDPTQAPDRRLLCGRIALEGR